VRKVGGKGKRGAEKRGKGSEGKLTLSLMHSSNRAASWLRPVFPADVICKCIPYAMDIASIIVPDKFSYTLTCIKTMSSPNQPMH